MPENELQLKRAQLEYPLDAESEATLRIALEKILPEIILKIVWEKYYFYLDTPAIIDGANLLGTWSMSASGGTFSYSASSLVMNSGGTNGNYVYATKNFLTGSTLLDFDKYQRFRTEFRLSSVSNLVAYITRANKRSADNKYFGFKIVNNSLIGVSRDGSASEQTIDLQTISANTTYSIEAILSPKERIVFMVNSKEIGALSSGIPSGTAPLEAFAVDLETTATEAQKTLRVSYFDFVQEK